MQFIPDRWAGAPKDRYHFGDCHRYPYPICVLKALPVDVVLEVLAQNDRNVGLQPLIKSLWPGSGRKRHVMRIRIPERMGH